MLTKARAQSETKIVAVTSPDCRQHSGDKALPYMLPKDVCKSKSSLQERIGTVHATAMKHESAPRQGWTER